MKRKISSVAAVVLLLLLAIAGWHCKKTNDTMKGYELVINSIDPDSGRAGSMVSISGRGFSEVFNENIVKFNDKPAEVLQASDTSLLVKAPEEDSTGPVSVAVNGQYQKGPVFTYIQDPLPVITKLNPTSILSAGNRNLTIEGKNFGKNQGLVKVYVGGQLANILVFSDISINVTTPAFSAGTVSVYVQVDTKASNTVQLQFY